jgi:predicted RNA-binding Zn-ribbon protein involved in translation (DUF1610 family)
MRRGSFRVDWHNEIMIRELVAKSNSQSQVLRSLGLTPASNAVTLRKYVKLYDIDISHFDPLLNRPQTKNGATKESLTEILVENSNRVDRYGLKKRLVNEGILKYKCNKCGNDGTWQGEKLSLQLEHKNGKRNDNRKENLCFLCPNCHSQTSTFAGRNKNV